MNKKEMEETKKEYRKQNFKLDDSIFMMFRKRRICL